MHGFRPIACQRKSQYSCLGCRRVALKSQRFGYSRKRVGISERVSVPISRASTTLNWTADLLEARRSAALEAADKVGLKLNAPKDSMGHILKILPALRNPTVNRLSDEGWSAVEVILSEKDVRDIIPKLKELGAEGIIEYPLNKVVY